MTLCVCAAQEISPTVIAGQAGENVTIMCTSAFPGEAWNNVLCIYIPEQDYFVIFESSPRLWRSNSGSISTYVFGPLMSSDNGTILRCTSSGRSSADATISITCESLIDFKHINSTTCIETLLFPRFFSFSLSIYISLSHSLSPHSSSTYHYSRPC